MKYNDFTEMPVWQKGAEVIEKVYNLCLLLPKSEDYTLSSQLKRASLSITANIAESFGRKHSKDKINFYLFARGSTFEVQSHLLIGKKLGFFTSTEIEEIMNTCLDIIESLNKIMKVLSQPNP